MMFDISDWFVRRDFGTATRIRLWKRLDAHARYGLSLAQSIRSLAENARRHGRLRAKIYDGVLRDISFGRPLTSSLAKYATPEELQLLAAGVESGNPRLGYGLATQLMQNRDGIRKAIVSAVAYPVFLFAMSIGLMVMLSTSVVPQFAEVLPPERWEGAAAVLLAVSSFVGSKAGAVAGVLLLLAVAAMFATFPIWTGNLRQRLDGCGPWAIYRLCAGSAWLFSVATFMRAGMSLRAVLAEMAGADAVTPYMKERVRAVLAGMAHGKDFGKALAGTGMNFPSEEVVDDIEAYSELPDFEHRLFEIVRDQTAEDVETIRRRMQRLNIGLMLFIALEMGLFIAAIYSLQSQLAG
jgi:type II secretory pathway component PulF